MFWSYLVRGPDRSARFATDGFRFVDPWFRQICFHIFRSTDMCTSTFYWWFGLGRFKNSESYFHWLFESSDLIGFEISIGYQASFWESRKAYFPWFGLHSFYFISVWFIFWRNFLLCTYERFFQRQEPMKLSSGLFSNWTKRLVLLFAHFGLDFICWKYRVVSHYWATKFKSAKVRTSSVESPVGSNGSKHLLSHS